MGLVHVGFQIGLGLFVGSMLYFNDNITIEEKLPISQQVGDENGKRIVFGDAHKSTKTTLPFLKNNELDYAEAFRFLGDGFDSAM